MALRTLLLLDAVGAPLTTATPTFVDYRDALGNARTPPSNPVHVGGGVYVYSPSLADETVGTVALIDGGASAYPRYDARPLFLSDNSNQFWAWHIEDFSGALWAGAAPTVASYQDQLGNVRTPAAIVAVAGAYLFALTPSAGDVLVFTTARIDMASGAAIAYLVCDCQPVVASTPTLPSSVSSYSNKPEVVAAKALIDYLVLFLPPKVAELNTLRAAVLQTPGVGTGLNYGWALSSGMQLRLSAVSRTHAGTVVTLPTGAAVAPSTIAAAINTTPVPGLTASVDPEGRLLITSNTAPTTGNSGVYLLADSTGGNAALGFDMGGESVMTSPLRAPGRRGVRDGYPTTAPDMGQGFWVILGDRDARPWPSAGADIRRGECDVHFVVELFHPAANTNAGHSREGISACLWAVREVLQTNIGRQLNRGGIGDIIRADIGVTRIAGRPFSFSNSNSPNVICDVAALEVTVRTFQRSIGA